jgi:hypothetical protein
LPLQTEACEQRYNQTRRLDARRKQSAKATPMAGCERQ